MNRKTYLDYNATAPLRPSAWEAINSIIKQPLNASSVHSFGRDGRKVVESARQNVAQIVGTEPNQVLFNSGATEGNNTVLQYFSAQYPDKTILVSSIEHPSILEMQKILPNVRTIPVDNHGVIDIDALETLLKDNKTSLVSCMAVNNETGVIQDVAKISAITHKHGALLHCDATQATGRMPIDMQTLGIDFITLSSHKLGGPQGVGALALGMCGVTPTLLHGGGQEKSARAGTENVAGIAGFGAAAKKSLEYMNHYQALGSWRDKLESSLKEISPEIIIHGEPVNRVANTTFFSLPGTDSQTLLMAFDLEGFALSNGSACSSGTVKSSTVLKAMGLDEKISASGLRISMGWATKEEEIDALLGAWKKIYSRLKR